MINPPISKTLVDYLLAFSRKRHFYTWGEHEHSVQLVKHESSRVVDLNRQHPKLPSLWCDWVPSPDGTYLYIRGDRPYRYLEWLIYLLDNFVCPAGSSLIGKVKWSGENANDFGSIEAKGRRFLVTGAITAAGKNPYVEEYLAWESDVVQALGGVLHVRA